MVQNSKNQSPSGQGFQHDWLDKLIARTLDGGVPMMILILSLALGAVALTLTPREEEPQIVVPMVDIWVNAPGLSARQVERQITTPMEKILGQIKGVEHIYSTSSSHHAIVTLRFYVGEDREDSILNTYSKLYSSTDAIPAAVKSWVVKPVEIDDVPILMLGLWSNQPDLYDDYQLRRLAQEASIELKALKDTNQVEVIGGRERRLQVLFDPVALAAHASTPMDIAGALAASNQQLPAGQLSFGNQSIIIEAGQYLQDVHALAETVINVVDGIPVYLKEVAQVIDGPALADSYSWLSFAAAPNDSLDPAAELGVSKEYPLVTISVAKQRGSNAVWVANDVHALVEHLQQNVLPPQVKVEVLRDYGETANEKVNNLTSSLVIAVVTVVVFIGLFLGWRPALVVGIAIPLCYGAALAINMTTGYTINRVTLFALILALGLLVDDPITGIDNIERFHKKGQFGAGDRGARNSIIAAMREIRIPLMMSTFTIILAFVPLGFITGMMGPYMAPMALNVPVTVMLSTFIAFFVTPWLAYKIYVSRVSSSPASASDSQGGDEHRLYRRMLMPLIGSRQRAKWFLWFIAFLFVITAMLPMLRLVPLKLLPFDNKNELQVLIDMPEGATLEQTRAVAQQVQSQVLRMPEIKAVAAYIGEPSPIDFNGLVRKYYARVGKHYGDLRLTLVDKTEREHQSHGVLLRLRPLLAEIEEQTGAKIKPVEVPPGPPVLSTLVAEIYGQADTSYARLQQASEQVMARLGREDGVVDVDSNALAAQQRLRFVPDQRKAALSGISTADIAQTLMMANAGMEVTQLQLENEISPLAIDIRLDESDRASVESLLMLGVRGQPGIVRERRGQGLEPAPQPLVPLAELGEFVSLDIDQPIFHKDLRPVVYVTAETAGRPPAEIVTDIQADQRFNDEVQAVANDEGVRPASQRTFLNMGGNDLWSVADDVEVVWSGEGEWKITIRVFRDMGLAFAFALLGIFIVLRFQTSSSALSLIIMSAIPLTVIGLMPGFWVLNMIGEREIAGFPEPVLFTATAMIGMIALAGIVVRNSLILVEFINNALKEGMPLIDALVQAGSTRMRPVLLTAGTTLLGNLVIVLDPVFSGLAWSIIFGIIASTAFTLLVIPCVYFMVFGNAQGELKTSPK